MPKKVPPGGSTELWRWMAERRVTLEELAAVVGVTPQHLSEVRRGVRRPSDKLKQTIETATVELERKQGVTRPKGVKILDWFKRSEIGA